MRKYLNGSLIYEQTHLSENVRQMTRTLLNQFVFFSSLSLCTYLLLRKLCHRHVCHQLQMAIVGIMGILNFDDDVQFWYTITVLMPICTPIQHHSPWNFKGIFFIYTGKHCSISHSKMLGNSAHLLIKFVIE